MTTCLPRLAALATLIALTPLSWADDPPAKPKGPSLSASVMALNSIFKKDADGSRAKRYVGRLVTVSGTVKNVAATDDGGQTLALRGLPPTADDPSGCTIPFPAGHKSLTVVKGLKEGMAVRVRGTIANVHGTAFALENPVLVSASAAPLAKRSNPTPRRTTSGRRPSRPKPEPVAPPPAVKPEDLKTTVVALTTKLRDDKTEKLWLSYTDKEVELTGRVKSSSRALDGGWVLWLLGCPSGKPDIPYQVAMVFPPGSPELPRLRNLGEGDTVTVRGEFGLFSGMTVHLRGPRLVAGGEKPQPALAPVRTADAEAFVKELLTDPAAVEKYRGKAVVLTGAISRAGPPYTKYGLSLKVGKLKPTDPFEVFAKCVVVDDQLEAVWQLGPGQKVRVVGVVTEAGKYEVRLAKCRVTLLGPNPMPALTAAELSAAFRADPKAAARKYGDASAPKRMFLTGEVTALTLNSLGNSKVVTLKVPAGPKVELFMWRAEAERLKVGQVVRFKATCRGLMNDKTAVRVDGDALPEAKTTLPLAK